MTKETKVGFFVLAGIFFLILSIALLGDFRFERRYNINILFNDIAGLPEKAKIKIAGVEVGAVKKITLQDSKANIKIWIKKDIKIHQDARASIVATGIIGSKYLELTVGTTAYPLLNDGDMLIGVDPVSFDKVIADVMKRFDALVSSFQAGEGESVGQNLSITLKNIRKVSDTLRIALDKQEDKIAEIIDNVHSFSQDIAEISAENKDNIKVAVTEIKNAAEKVDAILAKLDKGEGTIGKLITDKKMGDDLQSTVTDLKETAQQVKKAMHRKIQVEKEWDYRMRYDTKYTNIRNDFGLRIIPRPGKFYYLGGSNLGDDTATSKNDIEKKNTYNVLLGKQLGPLQVYGGIIRSKGGVGAKIAPFSKWDPMRRLEITAEAYDFTREQPVSKAKIDTGVRVKVTDWGYIGAQVEDVYYASSANLYMNLVFRDEDIAYLLGLVGLAKP